MNFKRTSFSTVTVFSLFITLFISLNSCKHEGVPADQFPEICFQDQILPIFQNSCASCHGNSRSEAGLDFSTYSGIMKAITPGDADNSKAYKAITSTFQIMPPNNALPEEKRILIRIWINQGAKETTCSTSDSGTGGTTTQTTQSGTLWACFDRDIQPILTSSCAISGCHNSATHKDGYDFSSYTKTLSAVSSGKPASSKLYKVITATSGSEDFMPPKPYAGLSKTAIRHHLQLDKKRCLE